MLDYQNGKIYTIRYRKDDSLIYVGSLCHLDLQTTKVFVLIQMMIHTITNSTSK